MSTKAVSQELDPKLIVANLSKCFVDEIRMVKILLGKSTELLLAPLDI